MAPTRGGKSKSASSKGSSSKRAAKPRSKPSSKASDRDTAAASNYKTKRQRNQKPKPSTTSVPAKHQSKRRHYTEAELKIPTLNTVTPAGVQKPRNAKKGKVFVDDPASMMTILAMVQADKEGQIESKMAKARQMEAIREARVKEAEAKAEEKQKAFVRLLPVFSC